MAVRGTRRTGAQDDAVLRMGGQIHIRLDRLEAQIDILHRIEHRVEELERQQFMAFERIEARLAHLAALERNNTQQQHQSQADLSWHMCELRQTVRQHQMQESTQQGDVQYIGPVYVYPEVAHNGQENFGHQFFGQRNEGLYLNIHVDHQGNPAGHHSGGHDTFLSQQTSGQRRRRRRQEREQNFGQQNFDQQNFGQQNISQQNISQPNIGQQNIGQQNSGQQTVDNRNICPQQVQQQAIGQQNIGQQNVDQDTGRSSHSLNIFEVFGSKHDDTSHDGEQEFAQQDPIDAEGEQHHDAQQNGATYNSDDAEGQQHQDAQADGQELEFDSLGQPYDISARGAKCFRCGSPYHKYLVCPVPTPRRSKTGRYW